MSPRDEEVRRIIQRKECVLTKAEEALVEEYIRDLIRNLKKEYSHERDLLRRP